LDTFQRLQKDDNFFRLKAGNVIILEQPNMATAHKFKRPKISYVSLTDVSNILLHSTNKKCRLVASRKKLKFILLS